MSEPLVVQVDEFDNELNYIPKMAAHRQGILHRAISVLIFDSNENWLLQKRAYNKYHSGGLWSNTCCSHPYPNEELVAAAERRLQEEMGILCNLEKRFSFQYKVIFDNGLIEHELDHVFIGFSDDIPIPNSSEVSDWRLISTKDLEKEINMTPEKFSEWFKLIFQKWYTISMS